MDLRMLSDEELKSSLANLRGNERETTLKILHHLNELECRKLFREDGYSSLFDYCTRKLNYSEASAYTRIAAARCLKDNPEVGDSFLKGKVTLSTISVASKSIRNKTTEVKALEGKTKREVEALVYSTQPIAKKPVEKIRPVAVKSSPMPLFAASSKEDRYELRFSVTKEVYNSFNEAKAILSNTLQKDLTIEAVFGKLLELYLKPKTRVTQSNINSRYVSLLVKAKVRKESQGQCCFVSNDGLRCTEKHYLQFDHIQPYALGGKTEASNLRLLCPAHNQLMAERCFNN